MKLKEGMELTNEDVGVLLGFTNITKPISTNTKIAWHKELERLCDFHTKGKGKGFRVVIDRVLLEPREKVDKRRNNKGGNNQKFTRCVKPLILNQGSFQLPYKRIYSGIYNTDCINKGNKYIQDITKEFEKLERDEAEIKQITDLLYGYIRKLEIKLKEITSNNLKSLSKKNIIEYELVNVFNNKSPIQEFIFLLDEEKLRELSLESIEIFFKTKGTVDIYKEIKEYIMLQCEKNNIVIDVDNLYNLNIWKMVSFCTDNKIDVFSELKKYLPAKVQPFNAGIKENILIENMQNIICKDILYTDMKKIWFSPKYYKFINANNIVLAFLGWNPIWKEIKVKNEDNKNELDNLEIINLQKEFFITLEEVIRESILKNNQKKSSKKGFGRVSKVSMDNYQDLDLDNDEVWKLHGHIFAYNK